MVEGNGAVTRDNWNGGVQPQGGSSVLDRIRLGKSWDAMKIDEQTPHEAYEAVLDRAGCSLPVRDAVDRRIVAEVRSGTATFGGKSYSSRKDAGDDHVPTGIIDSQHDVGGWPELKSAAALPTPTMTACPTHGSVSTASTLPILPTATSLAATDTLILRTI